MTHNSSSLATRRILDRRVAAGVLLLDTLNERGNIPLAQAAKEVPHVLTFEAELVLDGRTLEGRQLFSRAHRPAGGRDDRPPQAADRRRRPARRARSRHRRHEARQRNRRGAARRPPGLFRRLPAEAGRRADDRGRLPRRGGLSRGGRRSAIPRRKASRSSSRNCQAGWQIMMTAAVRPELAGVIMLAGTPLSYWAGVRGKNPMRYLGGTLGGTWLTALAGDLGAGHFRRREPDRQFRVPEPGQHLLDEALQRLFQGRYRGGALPRIRDLVGQPRAAERGRDAVDRRQPVRRQQALRRRDPHLRRRPHRSAQHPVADRRASAPGATTSRRRSRRWTGSLDLYDDDSEIVANGQTIVYSLHQIDRPSRHLRLGQGRDQGASRVRHLHGDDRGDAARPL